MNFQVTDTNLPVTGRSPGVLVGFGFGIITDTDLTLPELIAVANTDTDADFTVLKSDRQHAHTFSAYSLVALSFFADQHGASLLVLFLWQLLPDTFLPVGRWLSCDESDR